MEHKGGSQTHAGAAGPVDDTTGDLCIWIVLMVALLGLTACSAVDSSGGLGALGEECLADSDCRQPLLCAPQGECVEDDSWPLENDPQALEYPDGVYLSLIITPLNSNDATRRLDPFLISALEAGQSRLAMVLEQGANGLPFELNTGPVRGFNAEGLEFFEGPLRLRALEGQSIEQDGEDHFFELVEAPPRQSPQPFFFLLIETDNFFIPVPISIVSLRGQVSPDTDSGEDMVFVVDGVLLRDLAAEVDIEVQGLMETLDAFLNPETQDLDIDRDGQLDGWDFQLEITARRVSFE